jgi:nitrogen fixation protein
MSIVNGDDSDELLTILANGYLLVLRSVTNITHGPTTEEAYIWLESARKRLPNVEQWISK